MVVDYLGPADNLDRMFRALGDPTRRDILARVLQAERSVSTLARSYPMSFAAVQKHVAVLEQAGLIRKRRRGREQLVAGRVEAIQRAAALLDRLELLWRERIERFGRLLEEPEPPRPEGDPRCR